MSIRIVLTRYGSLPGLAQLHVKRAVAAVARAGARVAEHDGAQLGLAEPLRHAVAQDAALRFSQRAGEMIALHGSVALAGDDQNGLAIRAPARRAGTRAARCGHRAGACRAGRGARRSRPCRRRPGAPRGDRTRQGAAAGSLLARAARAGARARGSVLAGAGAARAGAAGAGSTSIDVGGDARACFSPCRPSARPGSTARLRRARRCGRRSWAICRRRGSLLGLLRRSFVGRGTGLGRRRPWAPGRRTGRDAWSRRQSGRPRRPSRNRCRRARGP